jgi:heptaprenyl diphosphate synthase
VFLFSLGGSFASAFTMLAAQRLFADKVSLVGISVFGAIASNVVQIYLSVRFIFGMTAWIIAPPFVALGVASGFAVGLFAQKFWEESRWLGRVRDALAR